MTENINPFAPVAEVKLATAKQVEFVRTLTDERDLTGLAPAYRDRVLVIAASIYFRDEDETVIIGGPDKPLTASGASALIDTLLPLPRRADAHPANEVRARIDESDLCPEVLQGRYAVTGKTTDATVFYRVDRPDSGDWAGRVFVSRQHGDYDERVPRGQVRAILRQISDAGVRESAIRYGHEIGRCALCGRTLTNAESRERGIGPKCAENAGW